MEKARDARLPEAMGRRDRVEAGPQRGQDSHLSLAGQSLPVSTDHDRSNEFPPMIVDSWPRGRFTADPVHA